MRWIAGSGRKILHGMMRNGMVSMRSWLGHRFSERHDFALWIMDQGTMAEANSGLFSCLKTHLTTNKSSLSMGRFKNVYCCAMIRKHRSSLDKERRCMCCVKFRVKRKIHCTRSTVNIFRRVSSSRSQPTHLCSDVMSGFNQSRD
jgi:hypothetical protein